MRQCEVCSEELCKAARLGRTGFPSRALAEGRLGCFVELDLMADS